jgi:hypothetical protein
MRDFTVNESQLRSLHAENFRGRGGFTLANLRRSERRWLAAGHIDKVNAMALLDEPGDCAAHAEFLVVGVGADDEIG